MIAARRLRAHRLTGTQFSSPLEAVRWLGAVQSQDYPGAKWALGLRARSATDVEIDRLFDEGAILRTHVLRPTWHFALREDMRWLVDLTGLAFGQALRADGAGSGWTTLSSHGPLPSLPGRLTGVAT